MSIFTLRGEWTKESVERIVGKPNPASGWEIQHDENPICGLVAGDNWIAGFGDIDACCHIHIHLDGVCLHAPSRIFSMLFGTVEANAAFAEAAYLKGEK